MSIIRKDISAMLLRIVGVCLIWNFNGKILSDLEAVDYVLILEMFLLFFGAVKFFEKFVRNVAQNVK